MNCQKTATGGETEYTQNRQRIKNFWLPKWQVTSLCFSNYSPLKTRLRFVLNVGYTEYTSMKISCPKGKHLKENTWLTFSDTPVS